MRAELLLKIPHVQPVFILVSARGQEFEPNRVQFQTTQPKHPLQRDGEIASPFAVFRGEPATEENRHAGIYARSRLRSTFLRRSLSGQTDEPELVPPIRRSSSWQAGRDELACRAGAVRRRVSSASARAS